MELLLSDFSEVQHRTQQRLNLLKEDVEQAHDYWLLPEQELPF